MSLTPRRVADIISQRLGHEDASQSAAIITQIPTALKETGRKIAADPALRHLLVTDPVTVKLSLASGAIDMAGALFIAHEIIREMIDLGDMYYLPAISFLAASVLVVENAVELPARSRLSVGDRVRWTSTGTLPTGLALATDYWIRTQSRRSENRYTFSPTQDLATEVDITATGSGTHTLTVQESGDHPIMRLKGGARRKRISQRFGDDFYYYYIQGDKLYLLPEGSGGQIGFAVPYYPATLAALPESEEAETIFLGCLLDLVMTNTKKEQKKN